MSGKIKTTKFFEQLAICLSSLFFCLFAWHQWWAGVSPRLIRGSEARDAIHHDHLMMGATLFIIICLALVVWLLKPGLSLREKLRRAFSNAATTAVSIFFISCFFNLIYGLAQAWAAGEETKALGVFSLPQFLDWDWRDSGYMHSALTSINMMLFAGIVFVFLYTKLRRYVEPGVAVTLLIVVHLLVNLPKPPSIHPIAAFGTYVMIPFFYFLALAIYTWAKDRKRIYWPVYVLFMAYFLYLPYFSFKIVPPWHADDTGEVVIVAPKDTLTPARLKTEIFSDPADLAAAEETAAWCMQCHNMSETSANLIGPRLANVLNRQAGTAADYSSYSAGMVSKGLEGVYWTRGNLSKFLSDGKAYVPGNLMNQRTDLSDPEKMQQVLDYLEYISAD